MRGFEHITDEAHLRRELGHESMQTAVSPKKPPSPVPPALAKAYRHLQSLADEHGWKHMDFYHRDTDAGFHMIVAREQELLAIAVYVPSTAPKRELALYRVLRNNPAVEVCRWTTSEREAMKARLSRPR